MIGDSGREPQAPRFDAIDAALAERDAIAFVHVGSSSEPGIRYCLGLDAPAQPDGGGTRAVALSPADRLVVDEGDGAHPAERLAGRLAEREGTGPLLVPATIPHDAALYLEDAGFELASTDALARARSTKTAAERERIDAVQRAAGAGIRRAGSVLAEAGRTDDELTHDGDVLTAERLRRAVDAAVVSAGAIPTGATSVETPSAVAAPGAAGSSPVRPGEPVVVDIRAHGPAGYHGRLVRTFVAESDGGWERRAHVAVESALRSARTMVGASEVTVREVETELRAEVRSFGFEEAASATVAGVGLEHRERPVAGSDRIEPGAIVALRTGVEADDGRQVALGGLLAREEDADWLGAPSRSLDPAVVDSA